MKNHNSMDESAVPIGAQAVTIETAASYIKVSEKTVRRMIKTGKIRSVRFGRAVRIPLEEIMAIVNP
jgi:excisionase family DNA binding protein